MKAFISYSLVFFKVFVEGVVEAIVPAFDFAKFMANEYVRTDSWPGQQRKVQMAIVAELYNAHKGEGK